jgi:hypothetical protein
VSAVTAASAMSRSDSPRYQRSTSSLGRITAVSRNVLTFIQQYLRTITRGDGFQQMPDLDMPLGVVDRKLRLELAWNLASTEVDTFLQELLGGRVQFVERAKTFLRVLTDEAQFAWFQFERSPGTARTIRAENFPERLEAAGMSKLQLTELWTAATHRQGGDIGFWVPELLQALSNPLLDLPEVHTVPAVRRVSGDAEDWSGGQLIARLARLQNPGLTERSLRTRFEHLNKLLVDVTGNASASIEVPHNRETILVHMDGTTLPLASLGTGIHEVIILGAAATTISGSILCIEEPEVHLHPTLQKKFMSWLQRETDNQYFITSHSAHLLDTHEASIFHIRMQNNRSTVTRSVSAQEHFAVCEDLGYRASDLLQANCVIWVEGPSDRIYLRHWIAAYDPTLKEALHYSILFYGGRLLSHLSAADDEVTDFIRLRRFNRNMMIVIDSDKRARNSRLNETKRRVVDEFDTGRGHAWVTKGREVENYVQPDALLAAIQLVHRRVERLVAVGQYDNSWQYRRRGDADAHEADKVKVAHAIAATPANLDVLDLRRQIAQLVTFVRESNAIATAPPA